MKAQAPWNDYCDNKIYDGDTIRHPSGETGIVSFQPSMGPLAIDCWLVDYGTKDFSRLGFQIGSKGRAVVIRPIQDGKRQHE